MSREHFEKLKNFFETHPAAIAAVKPLKERTTVDLAIHGHAETRHFLRNADGGTVCEGASRDPDFILTLSAATVDQLVALPGADVGEFGIAFFKSMVHEGNDRTAVQIKAGVLTLLGHGYLGVLAAGGRTVMGWLAQKGFSGVGGLKKAIQRLKESRK